MESFDRAKPSVIDPEPTLIRLVLLQDKIVKGPGDDRRLGGSDPFFTDHMSAAGEDAAVPEVDLTVVSGRLIAGQIRLSKWLYQIFSDQNYPLGLGAGE
jgi:hypothetical protein